MAKISSLQLKQLIEAAVFVSDGPLSQEHLQDTVLSGLKVSKKALKQAIEELQVEYQSRGVQLVEVASGYLKREGLGERGRAQRSAGTPSLVCNNKRIFKLFFVKKLERLTQSRCLRCE